MNTSAFHVSSFVCAVIASFMIAGASIKHGGAEDIPLSGILAWVSIAVLFHIMSEASHKIHNQIYDDC